MKRFVILSLLFTMLLQSCDELSPVLNRPDDSENGGRVSVENIQVFNQSGQIFLTWDVPEDPLFEYLYIHYSNTNAESGGSDLLSRYSTSYTFSGISNGYIYDIAFESRDSNNLIIPNAIRNCTAYPSDGTINVSLITDTDITAYINTNYINNGITETSNVISISNVSGTPQFLDGISQFTSLTNLSITNGTINNIDPLRTCVNITALNLSSNSITSINVLNYLTKLVTLDLSNNNLNDISGLSDLQYLTILNLSGNPTLNDLEPLSHLENLRTLDIRGCPGIPLEQVVLLFFRPNLLVIHDRF